MTTVENKKISQTILRLILNLWTLATMILFAVDFLSGNKYDSSVSAIGIIYLALLGIYASEKEFSRWKRKFISKFSGEIFVIIWTIIMLFFVICAPFSNGHYKIPPEFAIIYTSVIGVFAITQKSKSLYQTQGKEK